MCHMLLEALLTLSGLYCVKNFLSLFLIFRNCPVSVGGCSMKAVDCLVGKAICVYTCSSEEL